MVATGNMSISNSVYCLSFVIKSFIIFLAMSTYTRCRNLCLASWKLYLCSYYMNSPEVDVHFWVLNQGLHGNKIKVDTEGKETIKFWKILEKRVFFMTPHR